MRIKMILTMVVILAGFSGCGTGASVEKPVQIPVEKSVEGLPFSEGSDSFAEVYFESTGCMACSHCRSIVRSIEGESEGRDVAFGDNGVHVRYLSPEIVDIPSLIDELNAAGIIQFRIRKVFVSFNGSLKQDTEKSSTLTLAKTGQTFSVDNVSDVLRESTGRVIARVINWRKSNFSLKVMDVRN